MKCEQIDERILVAYEIICFIFIDNTILYSIFVLFCKLELYKHILHIVITKLLCK